MPPYNSMVAYATILPQNNGDCKEKIAKNKAGSAGSAR
jgi:hypothetical protein